MALLKQPIVLERMMERGDVTVELGKAIVYSRNTYGKTFRIFLKVELNYKYELN